ncbi:DUF192 domain-containing protein [Candidatus Woesearchaeota archaeon]|nr:DUF192 domain-containing protein [Candidatus Woesearchaeota archaeon]MBW3016662.1 DUF192 domain-containing protein [Candidatus Woesearchaeota archaeon]
MSIVNKTRDVVLAGSFEECCSFWQQTRGMMFRKEVVPLLFAFPKEQIVKLHSWFCPDHMDLVFLDENWEVVELQPEWPPWSSYSPGKPFMFLLELPGGTIYRSNTQLGDVINILR